jgi:hypothetical protein
VDTAQAKVDGFEATIRADQAAIEASRVAISYGTIRATIGGRTGVINVFPGSLVTPTTATPMVIVAQIAPITVMFTLPERQLAALREALRSGPVSVTALPNDGSKQPVTGKITFVDNTVDPQYGSIRVKAMFGNEEHRLWPGTYANVNATVQVLKDALSVPPQAIVTGPEGRFVYTVQADNKVARVPVQVIATTAAAAVIEGVQPGARVVTEGAQNLRPGSLVRKPPLAALRPRPPPPSIDAMTLSELCIRRPVMTVLLCLAVIVTGIVLYPTIPIAALPSFNSPVIQVTATLPGRARRRWRHPSPRSWRSSSPRFRASRSSARRTRSAIRASRSSSTTTAISMPPPWTCRPRCSARSGRCRSR